MQKPIRKSHPGRTYSFPNNPKAGKNVSLYGKSRAFAIDAVKGKDALCGESPASGFATPSGRERPSVGWRWGFRPAPSGRASANPGGVFRALRPSAGRRLRPRSPSPVPWRPRGRRKSRMRTLTATAGICASWTKACGGKGRSCRRERPAQPRAGVVGLGEERRCGAASPRPRPKASGFGRRSAPQPRC